MFSNYIMKVKSEPSRYFWTQMTPHCRTPLKGRSSLYPFEPQRSLEQCTCSFAYQTVLRAQEESFINRRHEPLQISTLLPWHKPPHCARLTGERTDPQQRPFLISVYSISFIEDDVGQILLGKKQSC